MCDQDAISKVYEWQAALSRRVSHQMPLEKDGHRCMIETLKQGKLSMPVPEPEPQNCCLVSGLHCEDEHSFAKGGKGAISLFCHP